MLNSLLVFSLTLCTFYSSFFYINRDIWCSSTFLLSTTDALYSVAGLIKFDSSNTPIIFVEWTPKSTQSRLTNSLHGGETFIWNGIEIILVVCVEWWWIRKGTTKKNKTIFKMKRAMLHRKKDKQFSLFFCFGHGSSCYINNGVTCFDPFVKMLRTARNSWMVISLVINYSICNLILFWYTSIIKFVGTKKNKVEYNITAKGCIVFCSKTILFSIFQN